MAANFCACSDSGSADNSSALNSQQSVAGKSIPEKSEPASSQSSDEKSKITEKAESSEKTESKKPEESSRINESTEEPESSEVPVSSESEESSEQEESKTPVQESVSPVQTDGEYDIVNGLVIVKDRGHYRALGLFGGGSGNSYVDALKGFKRDLGDSVTIYSVSAPLASAYYLPDNFDGYAADEKECFDSIASRLGDTAVYVDVVTELSKHTAEDIYLRTDHHWAPLGAYYAAGALAKAAGVPFADIKKYTAKNIEGYVGTMYAFTDDERIKNDPETFTYHVPENNDKCTTEYFSTSMDPWGGGNFFNNVGNPESNAYLTFMGGDEQIVKVSTNVKNGRKLMIVKDSYGNAMPGYLFGSFEEIIVCDMRYTNVNLVDLAKKNGITDLAFVMVSYSVVGDNADNLDSLRTM